MTTADTGSPPIAAKPRTHMSRRRRINFAFGVCTLLVMLSILAFLWAKDETLTIEVHYYDESRVTVDVDGRTLAFENLSGPIPTEASFSRSISVAKGTHIVKVAEEITDAVGTVTVDVYGTLYVIAFISGGEISFHITSTRPLYP